MGADHSTAPFGVLADLASARVGGRAVAANDDFFAPKSNLVKPQPAIFVPGKFTTRGKWMDGWESRRRRTPGHDWCIVAARHARRDPRRQRRHEPLHRQPSVALFDRRHRFCRAAHAAVARGGGTPWTRILRESPLRGDARNLLAVEDDRPWTHVRLNIVPDGGVARLRVYGEVVVDWRPPRVAAGRSISRRFAMAASCWARATCTSARGTT